MKKLFTIFILTVYLNTNAQQYIKLLDFNGANGALPSGSLISDGTWLYGMAGIGGANGRGLIFKIKPDGSSYTDLFDFNGINGQGPSGSLISDGVYLYGMTTLGGSNNDGTIFKIKPDGTGYYNLHDFSNLARPTGNLISDGTWLYGMTFQDGTNWIGLIFKIKTDGTGYQVLLDFNGTNGAYPRGSLISDGTYLYGMTWEGGANNVGVIFKIKPDGTGYQKLFDFNGTNGAYPAGSLLSDGTYLYGMTHAGGTDSAGVIFKIKPDGTGYQDLLDFNGANGANPWGSLINDGTYLYGMASAGGDGQGGGIAFKIKPDHTGYEDLLNFNEINGSLPYGDLLIDGTYLYGVATEGGNLSLNSGTGDGVIFKLSMLCHDTMINNPQTICNGNSYAFNGHNYTTTGNYYDTLHTTLGCDSIIVTQLIVNPLPNLSIFPSTNQVCSGTTVTLTINDADTTQAYIFYQQPFSVIFSSYDSTSFVFSPTSTVTYSLSAYNSCGGLSIVDSINLIPNPIIVSYTLTPDSIPHVWDVVPNVSSGTSPYTYIWSWADGTTDNSLYTSHTYTGAAHYNVCLTVTDANGCSSQYCENDSLYRTSQANQIVQINVQNATSGISQISNQNSSFTIYPNPTSSTIQITGITNQDEVKIYDVLGNEVLQSKQANIDVSSLPSAVYFVRVGASMQKFIKQ